MRTLRIRKFMVIGMVSVVIFPWIIYFFAHFYNGTPFQNGSQPVQEKLNETLDMIIIHSSKWESPQWQKKLQSQLLKENIHAEILSPSNRPIFKSRIWRSNPWISNQQFTVIENGKVVGTVRLYSQTKSDIFARILAVTTMILAIFFVGYKMQRYIVKPLEAMSGTARQIAEGDLDLNLPVSRVTEIAQVRSGFEVMVAGLREAFEKQAKLEEERRFFIGAIAHDLRTPLFALRGYLDGLEQGIAASPEKIAKYVSVCKDKSNQLERLVADLFAFTKLEYMEQTLHREKIDIEPILKSSIESLKPLADDKGVSVETEFPANDCEMTGDSHLLERAINNLLDNALRHTPNSSKIFVNWYKEPGKVTITVRDLGPGFSQDDLKHVFEPLYRGEVSRNRATGGAGLGLTIARRIFKAHGGELSAANHPDGGAVLTGWILK
ncbi:HAMP domain-containing sensor histidine kinase [Neobacillus niacini]|uniref:sensor histidine kinase n=1 Tax=Neobacillus niacini TaxID=86668 RepID=UPI002855713E|nr:HAMP domain-containing sensor histidine kinase [Neobacillus niacini]MDR7000066.1 signal transduction histidine kinase [Neobacillus niacini]